MKKEKKNTERNIGRRKAKKPGRTKKVAQRESSEAKKCKSEDFVNSKDFNDGKRLTLVERLKLIRNCSVLLSVIAAIVVFLKNNIVISEKEEIELVAIFSSIVLTLIAFLLFTYFIKHLLDLKNGSVEINKGTINKDSDDVFTSSLPLCMIILDQKVHYICIHHYFKVKKSDFVVLRRAPITKCIVSLQITHKEKQ